ncbi:protein kinase [Roseiconus nitratireducens]|uniref:Protein kinase n=1 Tax=Roseiconus nitratireducens TaxID=2605748 RepID=A0A5M6DCY9_9BACT|nr:protein kinase [Roseiconus nitratireducens]KAA5543035.1 protein kinase [Roseiconus nitratireducens]
MNLTRDAQAAAQIDAICDAVEAEFRAGELVSDQQWSSRAEDWLSRVEPKRRDWLSQELQALRDDLIGQSTNAESASGGVIPKGVAVSTWRAVHSCPALQDLTFNARSQLATQMQPAAFDADQSLLRAGSPAPGLFLLTEGSVEVICGEGPDRQVIDVDGPGGVLGEMSLLTGYPCSADVRAASPVKALFLPAPALRQLRETRDEFDLAFSRLVSQRLGARHRDALCGKNLHGYLLQRCVGTGAMGVVYRAEQVSDRTTVALKMLRHRFVASPNVVNRFQQEAALLQRLQHDNIISLRDHFVAFHTRFIALDYYDGADLRSVLSQLGAIPGATARAILGQIAAGLRHAHQCGVLHLDLKPANVLVNRAGHIAITDFGLSRLVGAEQTDRTLVGTPAYMPPEQFLMTDIGAHCDWYAFGCVAAELLSGNRLFDANQSSALLDQKFQPPESGRFGSSTDEALAECIRSALQPVIADRRLDLGHIAAWSRPVPELTSRLAESSFQPPDTVG